MKKQPKWSSILPGFSECLLLSIPENGMNFSICLEEPCRVVFLNTQFLIVSHHPPPCYHLKQQSHKCIQQGGYYWIQLVEHTVEEQQCQQHVVLYSSFHAPQVLLASCFLPIQIHGGYGNLEQIHPSTLHPNTMSAEAEQKLTNSLKTYFSNNFVSFNT